MSALTDLFTALANKIRSKTGGSDTYTPPEMVAAIDDVYDAGVAAGTTPTQTKTVTAGTSATTVTPDQGYALSSVTVNPTPSQTKSAGPNVSTNKDVTPDSGYLLSKVTITPLSHTGTYTPAANTAANDMGANHDNRYVNTSGMIVPSGNKSITANGTGIDVSGYATASVNVPNPTLSGDAATGEVLSGKTFYNNTYTKQTGTMTNRGTWTSTGNTANATTTKNVTIPAGYHNGSGYVQLASLSSQTGVDSGKTAIDASHVLSGYQGWVNGSKVSGTYTASVKKSTTTLWTNSAPTSNFDAQVVTLSSSMQSYDYLIITFKASATGTSTWQVYVNVSDFVNSYYQSGGSATSGAMASGTYYNGSGSTVYTYNRPFSRKSNTQISFSNCRRSTTSSAANYAQFVIPTKIEGMYYYT